MRTLAAQTISWSDRIALLVTLVGALGGAIASCLSAWHGNRNYKQLKPPSDSITNGAMTENSAFVLHTLTGLVADSLGKDVVLPTPSETQAGTAPAVADVGAPVPPTVDKESPPPPPPPAL